MPHTDAYGRITITPAEIEQQARAWRERTSYEPVFQTIWNPATLRKELTLTHKLTVKP